MTGYGYWTASSRADWSQRAWYVDYQGKVYGTVIDYDGVMNPDYFGVRPVIEVLKSKLS